MLNTTKLYKEAHIFNVYKMRYIETKDKKLLTEQVNSVLALNYSVQSCGGFLGGMGGITMINVRKELSWDHSFGVT